MPTEPHPFTRADRIAQEHAIADLLATWFPTRPGTMPYPLAPELPPRFGYISRAMWRETAIKTYRDLHPHLAFNHRAAAAMFDGTAFHVWGLHTLGLRYLQVSATQDRWIRPDTADLHLVLTRTDAAAAADVWNAQTVLTLDVRYTSVWHSEFTARTGNAPLAEAYRLLIDPHYRELAVQLTQFDGHARDHL